MELPAGYTLQDKLENSRVVQKRFVDVLGKNSVEISQLREAVPVDEILASFKGSSKSSRCQIISESQSSKQALKTSGLQSRRYRIAYECPLFKRSGILELIEVDQKQSLLIKTESQQSRLNSQQKTEWESWLDQQVHVCQTDRLELCAREKALRLQARRDPHSGPLEAQAYYHRRSLNWSEADRRYSAKPCQKTDPKLLRNIKIFLEKPSKMKERVCFEYKTREGLVSYTCLPRQMNGPEIEYTFASSLTACEEDYSRKNKNLLTSEDSTLAKTASSD